MVRFYCSVCKVWLDSRLVLLDATDLNATHVVMVKNGNHYWETPHRVMRVLSQEDSHARVSKLREEESRNATESTPEREAEGQGTPGGAGSDSDA